MLYVESWAKKKIEKHDEEKKTVKHFKESLAKFVEKIAESGRLESPVIFFIDELDRCRPSFAIELLERIKHILSVRGIVFVLSLDRSQLSHAIRGRYGAGFDADGYLRRFIDLNFELPVVSPERYIDSLFSEFDLYNLGRSGERPGDDVSAAQEIIKQMAGWYDLSLRAIGQCITELTIAIRIAPQKHWLMCDMSAFFIVLRASKPELFEGYASGKLGTKELLSELSKAGVDKKHLEQTPWRGVGFFLHAWSRKPGEFQTTLNGWNSAFATARDLRQPSLEASYLELYHRYEANNQINAFEAVKNRLDFAKRFPS